MKIYHTSDIIPYDNTVIALGEFDGLHIAHMHLINLAKEWAKEHGCPFGVMLFAEKLTKKGGRLIENDERVRLLSDCDFLYIQNFDSEFMNMTPFEFGEFLVEKLGVGTVFAGYNYRFGKGASGNSDTLLELGMLDVHIVDEIQAFGNPVSSSAIRECITSGDIELANKLLGRAYKLTGDVVSGKQNGRKLGFPTVNLGYNPEMTLPAFGVYAGYTTVFGKRYESVINVGNNPTFNAEAVSIESFIFDFDSIIYGEHIEIEFVKRLRGEVKFSDVNDLAAQVECDKAAAVAYFKTNLDKSV